MGAFSDRLFMLVLIIMTVCEATVSDPFSLTCENVTGSVGEVLTLSCDVSWHHSDCCIIFYKFKYAEDVSGSVICREGFPSDCEQGPKLTCSYSSNETLTTKVIIYLQTKCGQTFTYFTVNITDRQTYSSDDHNKDKINNNEETPNEEGNKSKIAVIIAAVSSIIVIIIIIMVVIHKRTCNCTNHSGLQMDYRGVSVSQT